MTLEVVHSRLVNLLVRLLGLAFTLGGLASGAWTIYFALRPEDPRRITPDGTDFVVVGGVLSLIALVIGAALLSVRTYRPDLGDSAWSLPGSASRDAQNTRNWWTGEPRS